MGNCVGTLNFQLVKMVSCSCLRRTCSARKSFLALQANWDQLRNDMKDVQIKIDVEKRRQMIILLSVVDWLRRVEAVASEFDKLKTEYLQQSAICGYCPANFNTSYRFGKHVATVRREVDILLDRTPVEVAQQSFRTVYVKRPVEQTIGMNSMLDEAWSYMENEEVGIIAILGMGGVGKTILMKQLHNKLCRSTQHFDVLFWIVVSSAPRLSEVQNDIGRDLGLLSDEWTHMGQDDKAFDIYNILMGKKYVLFLDDVWEQFDFQSLGVPRPCPTNKSKIVITSRSEKVCAYMKVDKKIKVSILNEEEAWDLFRRTVGEKTIDSDPNIEKLAKHVAKECGGLPLMVLVIGRTMSSRTTARSWLTALNRLKKYPTEFEGMGDFVFPLLKFSYDSIVNVSMQFCFLYCSLYPKDSLIRKDDIIDKWICEGFFDMFVDLYEARNEGYDYIDTLVNASLLEESSSEEIKMHDVIRDMAIWITCESETAKNKFMVRAGEGLTETPNMAEVKDLKRMSLMSNQITRLTGEPDCPELVTLFLNKGAKLNHIDNEFFQSMPNLRILDLSDNGDLKEIPDEICNLITLQYLNLFKTGVTNLPNNLQKLINLKWLCFPSTISQIIPGLLSSFKKLQVFYLDHAGVGLPPTFVEELESLHHLEDLGIKISTDIDLSRFSSSHKLASITTSLDVDQMTYTNLDLLFSQKVVNLKNLRIKECRELEYVISSEVNVSSKIINYSYTMSLRQLEIEGCPRLKDITVLVFAPNLEEIHIIKCLGMKELCGEWKWGHEVERPFLKLKILQLEHLPELESIYPNAQQLFPFLTKMEIFHCPKLKKLPFNSSSCNSGSGVTIAAENDWWFELEWEDEATRNAFRHCFVGSYKLRPQHSSFATTVLQAELQNAEASLDINHHLIDGGRKSFWLDTLSGKKCYMIAARGLSIAWGDDKRYWNWISLHKSIFAEVAMLRHVWCLELKGKISIDMLSPGTKYVAYLLFRLSTFPPAYGFIDLPVRASVGTSTRIVYLLEPKNPTGDHHYPKQRKDGWMEIELGEYFNEGGGQADKELEITMTETDTHKGGLYVQGIEIRPEQSTI